MSSQPSLPPGKRHFGDTRRERTSGMLAAGLTGVLAFGLCAGLLAPFLRANDDVLTPPREERPMMLVFQAAPPPAPVQKPETEKLLAALPAPDAPVLPVEPPPPPKPEPRPEPKPEPKPAPRPAPRPVPAPPQPKPAPPVAQPVAQPIEPSVAVEPVPAPTPQAPPNSLRAEAGFSGGDPQAERNRENTILAELLSAVEANKEYPRAARRAGAQGRVLLKVSVDGEGKITACSLASSSGSSLLDKAAGQLGEKLLGRILPSARGGRPLTVAVPVHYMLN